MPQTTTNTSFYEKARLKKIAERKQRDFKTFVNPNLKHCENNNNCKICKKVFKINNKILFAIIFLSFIGIWFGKNNINKLIPSEEDTFGNILTEMKKSDSTQVQNAANYMLSLTQLEITISQRENPGSCDNE